MTTTSTTTTTAPPRPRPSAAPARLSDAAIDRRRRLARLASVGATTRLSSAALDRRIRALLADQREKLTALGGGDYKRGCMLAFGGCPVEASLSPKAVVHTPARVA